MEKLFVIKTEKGYVGGGEFKLGTDREELEGWCLLKYYHPTTVCHFKSGADAKREARKVKTELEHYFGGAVKVKLEGVIG